MSTSAAYPPPPPYYKLYKNAKSGPPPPPPLPKGTTYTLYGATYTVRRKIKLHLYCLGFYSHVECCEKTCFEMFQTDDVLPSLEEQGVRQLYPKGSDIGLCIDFSVVFSFCCCWTLCFVYFGTMVDYKKELRTLNRDLQLNFLELADVLVERPSQYVQRIEEISTIFKNMHHLLNCLRPLQVCMLPTQVENASCFLSSLLLVLYVDWSSGSGDIDSSSRTSNRTTQTSHRGHQNVCAQHSTISDLNCRPCHGGWWTMIVLFLSLLRRRNEAQRMLKEAMEMLDS